MYELFNRGKGSLSLIGIFFIVLGVLILANPGATTAFIASLVGWAILVAGAGTVVYNLFLNENRNSKVGLVVVGALMVALGFVIIRRPSLFVSYLFVFLGLTVALNGVGDLMRASGGGSRNNVGLGIGVLSLIAGVAIVAAPFVAASMVTSIVGIALVVNGISELVAAFTA